MRGPGRPQRLLRLECVNHCTVIEHVDASIQSAKPGLMRQQLRERDFFFVGLGKFGPELRDAAVNVDLMFLQDMKKTRAADSFCRRPNENGRTLHPWFLATRVAECAVHINNRLAL